MEKSLLNDYLGLIQKLLTCPHGEEWIYLRQHEELVDAEFLQFMEQVAIQIEREGDRNSATFLHNWAAKLHHILLKEIKPLEPEEDKTEAYFDLIEQLLACPEGREEQLLIAHETLIGPGLVHALRNVSKQLRQRDENAAAQYLESIATDLSQAWLKEHDLPSPLKKNPWHQQVARQRLILNPMVWQTLRLSRCHLPLSPHLLHLLNPCPHLYPSPWLPPRQ